MVLERQRDIESQFWAAYCRQVWQKLGGLAKRRVMAVVIVKQTKGITTRVR